MMKKSKKNARSKEKVLSGKHPKASESVATRKSPSSLTEHDSLNMTPVWKFEIYDPVGCCDDKKISLPKVLGRLRNYESMKWKDIIGPDSHAVATSKIIKVAQVRLQLLRYDDIDYLFSLRISARQRLWGIKNAEKLKILWWDPEHKICPSLQKHT